MRRLELAIDDAVKAAPPMMRAVIEGLQALRGIAKLTATTLVAEVGSFTRFSQAKQLMAWAGTTPSEYSTGGPGKHKRGGITKSGNAHVRRVLYEAVWSYQRRPGRERAVRQRQRQVAAHLVELAKNAQHRLYRRYAALTGRGKPTAKVIAAVGRELLGFIWAIASRVEHDHQQEAKVEPGLRRAA